MEQLYLNKTDALCWGVEERSVQENLKNLKILYSKKSDDFICFVLSIIGTD